MAFSFPQALFQFSDLPRQPVDLNPLRGDRLVQRLDSYVLISQAHLQSVDPFVHRVDITHASHR